MAHTANILTAASPPFQPLMGTICSITVATKFTLRTRALSSITVHLAHASHLLHAWRCTHGLTLTHLQPRELKALQLELPKQLAVRHARGSSSAPAGQQQLLMLRAQLAQLRAQPRGLVQRGIPQVPAAWQCASHGTAGISISRYQAGEGGASSSAASRKSLRRGKLQVIALQATWMLRHGQVAGNVWGCR